MTYCFLILLLVLAKYNLLPFEINSKGNTSFTLAFINLKISELLSTWTTPCRSVCFQSPLSIIKTTSERTTYPKSDMIQRWNGTESASNRNCPTGCISFSFLWYFRWRVMSKKNWYFKSLQSGNRGLWDEQYIKK